MSNVIIRNGFSFLYTGCVDEKIMPSVIVRLLEKLRTFAVIGFFSSPSCEVNAEIEILLSR